MAEHAEAKKGQRNLLGKKHSPQKCRHESKSIANTADDDVLEHGRPLYERASIFVGREVSFTDELIR